MTSSLLHESSIHTTERGAQPLPGGGVRFSVWAPFASRVSVRVRSAASGTERLYDLERGERGAFTAHVAEAAAGDDYRFVVQREGEPPREVPDPRSRWQPEGVHGPSRVLDVEGWRWADAGWRGLTMADLVLYELHVGTFTREGTFDAAIRELRGLRALGVTAIEIMPVAEFPGQRNWGYDGVHLYAPQGSYGGPDGLRRLVDAAHRIGLAVILDVVYNHLGPEGNYLDAFGPYFTEAYRTPWGRALNYDGAESDEVRAWVLDNVRQWIRDYHLDGLRLDAVHGIFDRGAVHLLQEIAGVVHAEGAAAGRSTVCIAESDLNDARLIREQAVGGFGLDGQWADDFHHAVHALLTGERGGYYADFGDVAAVTQSLREPFVYAGQYSPHRRRRHGAPSTGIPRERFVVAIQNHDQVGNRAMGDRLAGLVDPPRYRLAASLLLLAPYVPLIFMGEEYGETNPFQYFVHHSDPELLDAVRKGRRAEFAAFGWDTEVPDPAAQETFERSQVAREKIARDARHEAVHRLYAALLRLRREEPALRPGAAPAAVEERGRVIVMRRGDLVAAFNCGDAPHDVELGAGALLFSSDAAEFGGKGEARQQGARVALPAWSAVLVKSNVNSQEVNA
ncbi:MAG: malto-oligosyltrehalose trehalohydrolase [Gemmatimonadaceae bacterium]